MNFLFNEARVFAEAKAEDGNVTVIADYKRHKRYEYTLDNIHEGTFAE